MRSHSLFNVLAGTSAAAGVNLLTAIQTGDSSGIESMALGVSAISWFCLAVSLARSAAFAEAARNEVAFLRNSRLKLRELKELEETASNRVRPQLIWLDRLSVLFLCFGVGLLVSAREFHGLLASFLD